MNEQRLREALGQDAEKVCQMILLVTDALGIENDIPTMRVYIVSKNGRASVIQITAKAKGE